MTKGRANMAAMRPPSPPASLLVAVVATWGLAVFFVAMAVLSLTSGHGIFSSGVAVALLVWALLIAVAAWFLLRRAVWSRGPVVAAGLLHVAAFGQFALTEPWTIVGAVAGLAAVVGAAWPSTRLALRRARS